MNIPSPKSLLELRDTLRDTTTIKEKQTRQQQQIDALAKDLLSLSHVVEREHERREEWGQNLERLLREQAQDYQRRLEDQARHYERLYAEKEQRHQQEWSNLQQQMEAQERRHQQEMETLALKLENALLRAGISSLRVMEAESSSQTPAIPSTPDGTEAPKRRRRS